MCVSETVSEGGSVREREREKMGERGHRRQAARAVIFFLVYKTVTAMDESIYKARHSPKVRQERSV